MSEKEARTKTSLYKQAYNRSHYESILVQYPKDKAYKDRIKTVATADGLSVNQWILKAIEKELEWYE